MFGRNAMVPVEKVGLPVEQKVSKAVTVAKPVVNALKELLICYPTRLRSDDEEVLAGVYIRFASKFPAEVAMLAAEDLLINNPRNTPTFTQPPTPQDFHERCQKTLTSIQSRVRCWLRAEAWKSGVPQPYEPGFMCSDALVDAIIAEFITTGHHIEPVHPLLGKGTWQETFSWESMGDAEFDRWRPHLERAGKEVGEIEKARAEHAAEVAAKALMQEKLQEASRREMEERNEANRKYWASPAGQAERVLREKRYEASRRLDRRCPDPRYRFRGRPKEDLDAEIARHEKEVAAAETIRLAAWKREREEKRAKFLAENPQHAVKHEPDPPHPPARDT
jgi:hypothetical protein